MGTGQAGNVASTDVGNGNIYRYYDYRHLIWGVATGDKFPVMQNLLLDVEGDYQYLGSAKQEISDNAGAADHYAFQIFDCDCGYDVFASDDHVVLIVKFRV